VLVAPVAQLALSNCFLPRTNLCGFASFSQIPVSFYSLFYYPYFASNLNHERVSLRCELSLEMGYTLGAVT
jgi:hypothetical protein